MSHVSVEAPALGVGRAGDRRPGLRREVGFIGLLWASAGSIIGSGWLFGAQGALADRGARRDHLLGHRRASRSCCSRSCTPSSAGCTRSPAAPRGSRTTRSAARAGASFGWFSWLQAATVAPIEVMAVIQYGQHYSFARSWMKLNGGQHVLTANGIVAAIVLMAIFTGVNFLAVKQLEHQQRRHLVEGRASRC